MSVVIFNSPGEFANTKLWLQHLLIKHSVFVDLLSQVGHLLVLPEVWISGSGLDHIIAYNKLILTSARGTSPNSTPTGGEMAVDTLEPRCVMTEENNQTPDALISFSLAAFVMNKQD